MNVNGWKVADKVHIIELKTNGTIKSIWLTSRGLQIEVRYFHNGEAKEVYFYEEELEDI